MRDCITNTLGKVLAGHPRPIPLHVPTFQGNCAAFVNECVETGWVSSAGAFAVRVVNIPSSAHLATSDIQKEITSAEA